MTVLTLTPMTTRGITHIPAERMMVTEASTLGFKLERLYDDACDVGIAIKSTKTGNITTWFLEDTLVDTAENELREWVLAPTTETVRKHRGLIGYKLRVFNT